MKPAKRILILGIGNILLKDDGVGIHAVRRMQKLKLPTGVDVYDGGLGGLSLYDRIILYKKVIIVDAAGLKRRPGAVARLGIKDIGLVGGPNKLTLHQANVVEPLMLAVSMNKCPEVVIYGIQPKDMGCGETLSLAVKRAVPDVIKRVIREIRSKS
ncbi:MAG: hydrogenase maturation protease [Candidatus Brocadiia bacterium]